MCFFFIITFIEWNRRSKYLYNISWSTRSHICAGSGLAWYMAWCVLCMCLPHLNGCASHTDSCCTQCLDHNRTHPIFLTLSLSLTPTLSLPQVCQPGHVLFFVLWQRWRHHLSWNLNWTRTDCVWEDCHAIVYRWKVTWTTTFGEFVIRFCLYIFEDIFLFFPFFSSAFCSLLFFASMLPPPPPPPADDDDEFFAINHLLITRPAQFDINVQCHWDERSTGGGRCWTWQWCTARTWRIRWKNCASVSSLVLYLMCIRFEFKWISKHKVNGCFKHGFLMVFRW